MKMIPKPLEAGAFVIALGGACAIAYAFGGGLEARRAPPSAASAKIKNAPPAPSASAATPSAAGVRAGSDAEEVELRLTHALDEARVDVPSLARAEGMLAKHWRRMQLPWVALGPMAKRVTTSIALRTSAEEKQWAMPKKDGGTWVPDAKVWNMNEGSFDQRESIFAPTPALVGFRVTVPPAARLSFAAALLQKNREPTTFVVAVAEGEHEKEACKVQVTEPQHWHDVSCDLAPFAGKNVELRLRTSGGGEAPSLALWGNPTLLARRRAEVPYNVLWIVIDALRPDVLASFHDDEADARVRAAELGPLDALLPKVPGLMPALDELATQGVRFTRAWSAGAWTRPGTLAMLAGALSSQLGVDSTAWIVPDPLARAYYQSDPPLLPLLLRHARVSTRAFVNNYFMVGYAAVGVDMGFERVDDHRYRTRDTAAVTNSAVRWIRENKDARFFAFVNYNSPHEPWEPPARMLERLPPPCNAKAPVQPCGPREDIPRKYMAEAAKDDEAVATVLRTVSELGLRDRTLVVVTADHGETLSSAHAGRSKLDDLQVRYHHAVSNYEETTRVPILISLPGVLPTGLAVKAPVSTIDLAPTVLEILGMKASSKMTGRSLMPLVKSDGKEAAAGGGAGAERAIVSEGRGTRAILYGRHRLLVREGAARITTMPDKKVVTTNEELFDHVVDPGERRNVAASDPARVSELRARLDAALKNVATADVATTVARSTPDGRPQNAVAAAIVQLRFAGAGKARRITGTLVAEGATLSIDALGASADAVKVTGGKAELALVTDPEHVVGLDVKVDPPSATLKWELFVDDRPLPKERVYGGTFGLADPSLERGLSTERARIAARATALPEIDASRDLGLFVARLGAVSEGASGTESTAPERATGSAAAAEMNRMLREWGYANKPDPKRKP